MTERKRYSFSWKANGYITVTGTDLKGAMDDALHAVNQMQTMEAGSVSVAHASVQAGE